MTGKQKQKENIMNKGIQKLLPVLIILLGFFTFGISDLIWIYIISDKFDRARFLPMKQVALTVITFGIYGILWVHTTSSAMQKSMIIKNSIIPIACTVLSIVFLRTISIFILYRALNEAQLILAKEEKQ